MSKQIISVLLQFKENLSKNINPAIQSLNKFDSRISTLKNVMMPLSATSGLFLAGAAKSAFDFSERLKETKKGLGITGKELKEFGDTAKKMSENLNFQVGSGQLLSIATAAGKLGVAKKDLEGYTEGLVKFAIANDKLDNIEQLNENVAKINSTFKMGIPELKDYFGALSVLADSTSANASQLATFAQQSASTAKAAGLSAKRVAAWGATLIDAGQTSGQAATFLRNFTIKLGAAENQSGIATAAFNKLGWSAKDMAIAFDKDAEGAMIKFLERVKDLQKVDSVAATNVMASVFGAENVSNANLILGKLDDLKKNLDTVGDKQANAAKLSNEFKVSSEGLSGAMRAAKNVLNEIAIELGTAFLPGIVKAAQGMLEFMKPILSFIRANPKIAATIATFLGIVAVIAPLLSMASALSTVLALIPGIIGGFTAITAGIGAFSVGLGAAVVAAAPFLAAGAAIAALAYTIITNWKPISQFFVNLWDGAIAATERFVISVNRYFIKLQNDLTNWASGIKDRALSWGSGLVDGFVAGIQSNISKATNAVGNMTSAIADYLPQSPSKKGALQNLHKSGNAFVDTFMRGIENNPLTEKINGLFQQGQAAYNNNVLPVLQGAGAGAGQAVNITYNINAGNSDDLMKKLKERDRELLRIINNSSNRINRSTY